MKNLSKLFALVVILLPIASLAQLINVNPDPNGDPWYAGDAILASQGKRDSVPNMVLSTISANTPLPNVVKNNEEIWMPPVFNQTPTGACVQVAEVYYTFGYEINRLRNVNGGDELGDEYKHNQYHPYYTYNFLHDGSGTNGTYQYSGFDIVVQNGCPSYDFYDDPALHNSSTRSVYWMHGFENYQNGMYQSISAGGELDDPTYEDIEWGESLESLDLLKHWIADHNEGVETGGLAVIWVKRAWWTVLAFLPGTPEGEKQYISEWGTDGPHAVTIVGYHDDVQCFDLDNDGEYTNEDRDGDGIIELSECEKGAFLIVDSYGEGNGSDGYLYVPYKLMDEGMSLDDQAYTCYVSEKEPEVSVKTNVEHNDRKALLYKVGFAEDANQANPIETEYYKIFKRQGGDNNDMRGAYSGPIESALNFSYWFGEEDFGKIFFQIDERDYTNSDEGQIVNFSIVDNRWGEEFELSCQETNVEIQNHTITTLSVDYDLIVPGDDQLINNSISYFSNMVSRFKPTVTNNSTLTVESEVKIDMYNSELIIEEGSTLIIEDGAVFTAKRGISKIIVNGNIQIGNNVLFTADENSKIVLDFNNESVTISACEFVNAEIKSSCDELNISLCDFSKSFVSQCIGDLSISGTSTNPTTFSESSVLAFDPTANPALSDNEVSINYCNFITAYDGANSMIEVYGYKSFLITNNVIDNLLTPASCSHGISINYSGFKEPYNVYEISNNEIYYSFGSGNDLSGITVYSGIAYLKDNYIHLNNIGIQSLRNAQVEIFGYKLANYESETQRIKNNNLYQVYASTDAYPTAMHWNVIYGGSTDCFVYHDVENSLPKVDARWNYWGTSFDADVNLCPIRHYEYEPIWELNGGMLQSSAAQQLYETGLGQIADSNFITAKTTFKQVVTDFPTEEPSIFSMKELLYLEPLADNNFTDLKDWYLTEPAVIAEPRLEELGKDLANKCDEKLENYPNAISWYESIIQNPPSIEDSIFAIIDLEHLYWQMGIDTNLRSTPYIGSLVQFVPKSFNGLRNHRDELLGLLHGGKNQVYDENENIEVTEECFIKNLPNPFASSTTFDYFITIPSNYNIVIYSQAGKLIKKIELGYLVKGNQSKNVNMSDLSSGIYFYSLQQNGRTIATNKMVIY